MATLKLRPRILKPQNRFRSQLVTIAVSRNRIGRRYATAPPEPSLERAKDKTAVGVRLSLVSKAIANSIKVFDWRAAVFFVATGIGLYYYFEHEKAKVQERKSGFKHHYLDYSEIYYRKGK